MYVIATGDPWDGMQLWGPFEDMELCHDWAEQHFDDWTCIKLKDAMDLYRTQWLPE